MKKNHILELKAKVSNFVENIIIKICSNKIISKLDEIADKLKIKILICIMLFTLGITWLAIKIPDWQTIWNDYFNNFDFSK